MDCANHGAPPPSELRLAWGCKRWNAQPEAGGYLDQDFVLDMRMTAVSNIYDALTRMRNLPGKDIHKLTENERRILRGLIDLGMIFNG